MKLKSYYAVTVDAAIRRARQELGEDAMLLDTRLASDDLSHLGKYEVVFAQATPTDAKPSDSMRTTPIQASRCNRSTDSQVPEDVGSLRRELERINSAMVQSSHLSLSLGAALEDSHLAAAYSALRAEDIPHNLASELIVACRKAKQGNSENIQSEKVDLALQAQLWLRIKVAAHLGSNRRTDTREKKTIVLVGPPGGGKTSALVKLAAQYGLKSQKPMQILSIDNYRVGGWEQLRTYASILGVGFQGTDSISGLKQLLDENGSKSWIWIDTPGLGPRDLEACRELADFFQDRQGVDIHLVLSATSKVSDMLSAAERYRCFQPTKLLFTHLDETEQFGGIWSTIATTALPVSFFSWGQQIPDDLEAATAERLLTLVTDRVFKKPLARNTAGYARAAASLG